MMGAGITVKAQEIVIPLESGWTWISHPYSDTMTIDEGLRNFEPKHGDIVKAQTGASRYVNDRWVGAVTHLIPGNGYVYYSSRTGAVSLIFVKPSFSSVTTDEPSGITATSAVLGGTVSVPEGGHVFLCGVCWGTEPHPDIDGNHTSDDTGAGNFSTTIEGLSPHTTYYVRAYLVSDDCLSYGNELIFSTL